MIYIKKIFNKRLIVRVVPYFYGITTLFILIFNDSFGEDDNLIVFSLLFFTSMAIWAIRWVIIQVRLILTLKNEKKKAELLHLKTQVNPHFFFNTLNNLYGLVDQDPTKAQELILKLSEMMRYSIYEGQKEWVTLDEEIEYIENYMDLHRMRYHKAIDIKFDIQVEDRNIKVMPLLFIILVENAFKHGVEKLRKDAFVHLRLVTTSKVVDFEVENNFDMEEVQDNTGIGLNNLRQRLELVYSKKYELEMSELPKGIFKARLILKKL